MFVRSASVMYGFISLHKLLLGAFWANDIGFIGDESTSNQRRFAESANEAIVVPMAIFE